MCFPLELFSWSSSQGENQWMRETPQEKRVWLNGLVLRIFFIINSYEGHFFLNASAVLKWLLQARPLLSMSNLSVLVDPRLRGMFDPQQMERMISAAALCVRSSATMRPKMSQVRRVSLISLSVSSSLAFNIHCFFRLLGFWKVPVMLQRSPQRKTGQE